MNTASNNIDKEVYYGKNVLITGGLGFIGSNLAIALVELGANVTIIDAMLPGYGGNMFNIEPVKDRVLVNLSDVRDRNIMSYLIRDQDFVFHLAGQMDHVLSLKDPFPDIEINIKGTAVVMEACKHHNPGVHLIYSGTRGQYGPSISLPVKENDPTNPKGIHEISRLSAEKIIQVYHDVHNIRSVSLRITNTYGPRAQMNHSRYGVVNWFVRLAIDNERIKVFGKGDILRDFLYIDDCVRGLLTVAACNEAYGEVFNLATGVPSNFQELAQKIVDLSGSGYWEFAPFSPERKAQEPGDFYADISKVKKVCGWNPRISLRDGLMETINYYRQYKGYYWD